MEIKNKQYNSRTTTTVKRKDSVKNGVYLEAEDIKNLGYLCAAVIFSFLFIIVILLAGMKNLSDENKQLIEQIKVNHAYTYELQMKEGGEC